MEYFYKILASDEVQKIMLNIVIAILSWIGLKISVLVSDKIKNEKVKNALQAVYGKVSAVVIDVYKSGSEDLKKKAKDGKFTPEEKAEWISNILAQVKLTKQAELNQLKLAGEDIEGTIKFYSELAWAEIKKKLSIGRSNFI